MGNSRWRNFRSVFRETDLWVAVDGENHDKTVEGFTLERIRFYRKLLDEFIIRNQDFGNSMIPVRIEEDVHPLVTDMCLAADSAGTGPMSSVAGAIAEYICKELITEFGFNEVVIENGGDIFMKLVKPATLSVYAGESPLSEKVKLVIKPEDTPVAVCTSSSTTGHSVSFGKADACMIACRSGALADAYATAFCNEVKSIEMVMAVTEKALKKPDILSVVIIMDDKVGLGGILCFSV